tara:strand:- start:259 stop:474 length:216 start_codon:yes stop_codon:yes gene_type:complete
LQAFYWFLKIHDKLKMNINWPLFAVITWFLAFGTGVWADMPDPINLTNILGFLAFVAFVVYYRITYKKQTR